MKKCPKCGKTKKESAFKPRKKILLSSWCRQCTNEATLASHHEKMKNPEYREKRRKRSLNDKYLYKFGITYEDKLRMIERQDGKCAICKNAIGAVEKCYLDHDHKTGKARGILCAKCNTGLSYIEIEGFVNRCLTYLEKYEV